MAAKKKVAVLLRQPPLAGSRLSEGLRMSVGLTLTDGVEVAVALLGDAVGALETEPAAEWDFRKHLDMLVELKVELYAGEEELKRRGARRDGVTPLSREALAKLLSESEVVINW